MSSKCLPARGRCCWPASRRCPSGCRQRTPIPSTGCVGVTRCRVSLRSLRHQRAQPDGSQPATECQSHLARAADPGPRPRDGGLLDRWHGWRSRAERWSIGCSGGTVSGGSPNATAPRSNASNGTTVSGPSTLQPGQKLTIRSSGGATASGDTYVVRRGDTLGKIAQARGVSLNRLAASQRSEQSQHDLPWSTTRDSRTSSPPLRSPSRLRQALESAPSAAHTSFADCRSTSTTGSTCPPAS